MTIPDRLRTLVNHNRTLAPSATAGDRVKPVTLGPGERIGDHMAEIISALGPKEEVGRMRSQYIY